MIETIRKNWLIIFVALVLLVFIFFVRDKGKVNSDHDFHQVTANNINSETENNDETNHTVVVDIKGEVQNPGVYEVDKDLRVNDVVELAGGLTKDADELSVNLAQKVQDEMVIYISNIGEEVEDSSGQNNGKIKINYATQEEIETLNGIGPAKAEAIIQYREENGFFQNVDDLLEVSGIGEKTLENIREDIQIP